MCYNSYKGGRNTMHICPKCHAVMSHVLRFSLGKSCELYTCKMCSFETKPKQISYYSIRITQDNSKLNAQKSGDSRKTKNKKNTKKGKK